MRFDWHKIYRPWMLLNGRNAPVADYAEIKSSYGAHQKKMNEALDVNCLRQNVGQ